MSVALILACSATKAKGPASALELYDGPRWRTLRAALKQVKIHPPLFALSAEYGLISVETIIKSYNHRLHVGTSRLSREQFEPIMKTSVLHLSMGNHYALILTQFLKKIEYNGRVERESSQDLGYQRAAIWRILIRYEMGI